MLNTVRMRARALLVATGAAAVIAFGAGAASADSFGGGNDLLRGLGVNTGETVQLTGDGEPTLATDATAEDSEPADDTVEQVGARAAHGTHQVGSDLVGLHGPHALR